MTDLQNSRPAGLRPQAFTALGRVFDPLTYWTHRVVVVLATVGGLVGLGRGLVDERSLADSLWAGVIGGFTVAAAWAIARELDPDHDPSALVAGGVALLGFAALQTPLWLVGVLAAIMLPRVINQSAGVPLFLTDAVFLVAFCAVLGLLGWWSWGVLLGVALLANAWLPRSFALGVTFGAVGIIAAVAAAALSDNLSVGIGEGAVGLLVSATVLAYVFIVIPRFPARLASQGDVGEERLLGLRVMVANIFALAMLFGIGLQGNRDGLDALPLWAALLGVLVWRLHQLSGGTQTSVQHSANEQQ
ncbi:MAG: hypothetical protein HC915_09560 [Anaerolineae bacterium]|nr:hypothetical protein [Anaerolineae bacterium]